MTFDCIFRHIFLKPCAICQKNIPKVFCKKRKVIVTDEICLPCKSKIGKNK